jgi:hypothetical protein
MRLNRKNPFLSKNKILKPKSVMKVLSDKQIVDWLEKHAKEDSNPSISYYPEDDTWQHKDCAGWNLVQGKTFREVITNAAGSRSLDEKYRVYPE